MRRVLIRGGWAAAVSCGTVLALSVPAGATTVPEETKPGAESSSAAEADPELEAAMAVFDERMADAGFTNLGPQPEIAPDRCRETEPTDPALYEGCDPEVAKGLASFENFDAVFGTARCARWRRPTGSVPPADTHLVGHDHHRPVRRC